MSVDRDGGNRLWPVPPCQRTDHWYADMLHPMSFSADDGNFPEKVCPAWRSVSFALLQYPRTERCNDLLKRKRSLISVSWQGMVRHMKKAGEKPASGKGMFFHSSRRICGKRITSRILGESVSSMTRRSMPIPQPPAGGMPYSRARI